MTPSTTLSARLRTLIRSRSAREASAEEVALLEEVVQALEERDKLRGWVALLATYLERLPYGVTAERELNNRFRTCPLGETWHLALCRTHTRYVYAQNELHGLNPKELRAALADAQAGEGA